MTGRYWTTLEESKNLVKLGINEDTSDMHWVLEETSREGDPYPVEYIDFRKDYWPYPKDANHPAWSLNALLQLFPKYSLSTNSDNRYWDKNNNQTSTKLTVFLQDYTHTQYGTSIMDVVYNAVCFLLSKGKLNK